MDSAHSARNKTYWRKNLQIVSILLLVWFLVSYGCSILWVDALDAIEIKGVKLGFWFAQQGSIFSFVVIIFVYVALMNRLEDKAFEHHEASNAGGES